MASKKLAAVLCAVSLLGAGIAAPSANAVTGSISTKNGQKYCVFGLTSAEKDSLSKAGFDFGTTLGDFMYRVSPELKAGGEAKRQETVKLAQDWMAVMINATMSSDGISISGDSESPTWDTVIAKLKAQGVYSDTSKYDALRQRAVDMGVTDAAYAITIDLFLDMNFDASVTKASVIDAIDRNVVVSTAEFFKNFYGVIRDGLASCINSSSLTDKEKTQLNKDLSEMDEYIAGLGPDRPKKATGFFGSSFSS
ncbi:MAG: hypothetical protein Q3962_05135 [Corynebacterium sp.]|nr:hypothetical protein [Corynebacterium sp.]